MVRAVDLGLLGFKIRENQHLEYSGCRQVGINVLTADTVASVSSVPYVGTPHLGFPHPRCGLALGSEVLISSTLPLARPVIFGVEVALDGPTRPIRDGLVDGGSSPGDSDTRRLVLFGGGWTAVEIIVLEEINQLAGILNKLRFNMVASSCRIKAVEVFREDKLLDLL